MTSCRAIKCVYSVNLVMPQDVICAQTCQGKYDKIVIDGEFLEGLESNAQPENEKQEGKCGPGPLYCL